MYYTQVWIYLSLYICILAETPPPKTWVDADICKVLGMGLEAMYHGG